MQRGVGRAGRTKVGAGVRPLQAFPVGVVESVERPANLLDLPVEILLALPDLAQEPRRFVGCLLRAEVGVLSHAQRPAQRTHVPVEFSFGARRIVPLHGADPVRRRAFRRPR
ncbi:hypothetical protein [Saccharopolyspora spinosa]|uniref:hypothetical protein n=1 Tax=Saccharopolyspora spinosa TaxID=60894 RepID=UPI000237A48D|nr:hypothetical protein [Saccharopolyspora spinosa]